jgi:hypothetical protein
VKKRCGLMLILFKTMSVSVPFFSLLPLAAAKKDECQKYLRQLFGEKHLT